jgi:hypothetical protein
LWLKLAVVGKNKKKKIIKRLGRSEEQKKKNPAIQTRGAVRKANNSFINEKRLADQTSILLPN